MITRFLQFMAPADDAGGETAVLEPPVKEAAMTPVGDVYAEALKKAREGESDATTARSDAKKAAPAKDAKESDVKEEPAQKVNAKPVSALDAALGDAPTKEKEAVVENDPLKDLPEMLPREGRGEHWAKARGVITGQGARIGELTKTNAELLKQVETAKSTPPELAKENAALKKTLDSYKDAIVAINLEMEPEFRAKYVDGRTALVNKAASKLDAFGGKGEQLKAALGMTEGRGRTQAIKEALGDLEDVERSRVLQFVGEVEKLDDERAELQKDPQQAWEKLQRTQTELRQKQSEQAEAYKRDVFETVSKSLPTKLALLKTVDPSIEGATEWNTGVQEIKDAAFKLLGNDTTPEQLAEAALWATAGPKIQEHWMADREELKKARAALREYEESEPGFRGGKPPQKDAKTEKIETDPGKLYEAAMASQHAD